MRFEKLFTPVKIGNLTLKNRVVSSPTSQNDINPDGTLNPYNCAYYARKARGGAAMVTVGDCIVHPSGKSHPNHIMIRSSNCLHSLMRCAEGIHRFNAVACCQLSHGGMTCNPEFIGSERPWGPSEHPVTIGFQTEKAVQTTSRELTEDMIEELVESFALSALNAKRSYFDMVQLHAGHGWLIGQFFSPNINKRTDRFGGNTENRCRFALMIIERIRERCGAGFPVELRINGSDYLPDGLQTEEAVKICGILAPHIDSIHVSASVHYDRTQQDIMQSSMFMQRGHLLKYAAAVKEAVKNIPVTAVGGFSDPVMMEKALTEGKADIIALGRQLVADPDTVNKAKSGNCDRIRTCLRCGTCQSHRFMNGAIRCSVNPETGYEYEVRFMPPAQGKKRVLTAGGGPCGMQAAVTAARRGHDVTLCEKSGVLGGALNFAEAVPFKRDLYALIRSLEAELRSLKVDLRYNTQVTPELVMTEGPDVLIAAVGAVNIWPSIPGINKKNVIAVDRAYKTDTGDAVVMIGGGLCGIETALYLAMNGKKVTVIEMAEKYAADANFRHIQSIDRELAACGVSVKTETRCVAVTDDGIKAAGKDGIEFFIPADTIVVSAGMKPLSSEVEALRDAGPEFVAAGNCSAVGTVRAAIVSGYNAAINIAVV
ncbi:MAG: FAD-dependent oxidoreductase [Oscillospiraceae bacterium]|nr:FAD-dependent oxidoreductase [Oscillospiraceae bacterium]